MFTFNKDLINTIQINLLKFNKFFSIWINTAHSFLEML